MLVVDAKGKPLAVQIACASQHESVLVESTLAGRIVEKLPTRLIGDKAYDSDTLDEKLQQLGIEMIAPHRRNRVKAATQDGRSLRRAKRRWKIERTNAWLKSFRRLCLRWEWYSKNFFGFVLLACIVLYIKSL